MKLKSANLTSQILVTALAALILLVMVEVAQAQQYDGQNQIARVQNNYTNTSNGTNPSTQVIQTRMNQKTWGQHLMNNTTLGYYQQFLGPTASGSPKETYNPFVEGRAPLQSFHAFNLRHQLNPDWAFGGTLTTINGYTETVETKFGGKNSPKQEWFNTRAYLSIPSLNLRWMKLFTTISYEAPTSVVSRRDEMRFGWVVAQSLSFNLPGPAWSAGILGQYYRAYFKNNVIRTPSLYGFDPILNPMQTVIVSGGPYLSYRFNDKWMLNSLVTFDWDQKGVQTDTREFNNNLDHRARLGVSYFPQIKYLTSVGLFTQGLVKFRPGTTAIGAEFSVKF